MTSGIRHKLDVLVAVVCTGRQRLEAVGGTVTIIVVARNPAGRRAGRLTSAPSTAGEE